MEKKLEFTKSARFQIEKITKSDANKYFRIAVQGGGCSGFKYSFSFDDKIQKDDILFDKAIIDIESLNITLVFSQNLMKMILYLEKQLLINHLLI